jgi:hypothetical protein
MAVCNAHVWAYLTPFQERLSDWLPSGLSGDLLDVQSRASGFILAGTRRFVTVLSSSPVQFRSFGVGCPTPSIGLGDDVTNVTFVVVVKKFKFKFGKDFRLNIWPVLTSSCGTR